MNSQTPRILEAFSVDYRLPHRTILDEVSFQFDAGQLVTLVGPNGSGKSTLLKIVAGILAGKSSGVVRHRGEDLKNYGARQRARAIAYVGADLRADFPMTVREAVLLGRLCQGERVLVATSPQDEAAIDSAMEQTGCFDLQCRELHTLSGGERQRVAIARALAQGSKVLLLDESLSRMDLHHQAAMGRFLRDWAQQTRGLVVLVSHDWNVATEWANDCLVLSEGKAIAQGDPRTILNASLLERLYPGAGFQVGVSPVSGAPKIFFGPQK